MAARIDLSGLTRIKARLGRVATANFEPLMQEWRRILEEDNERGLLSGEDAAGKQMRPTQREQGVAKSRRLGGGPPLVPNRQQSRAARQIQTTWGRDGRGWFALLAWFGFTDKRGRFILSHHRNGIPSRSGPIVRDVISRPRPNAVKRATEAARRYVATLLRRR